LLSSPKADKAGLTRVLDSASLPMMRIILQGGPCDGDKVDLRDVVREFSKDGNVYKIMDGFFIDGRHFFQFDQKVTSERKHNKPDGPRKVE
jgi:hypothetical protein